MSIEVFCMNIFITIANDQTTCPRANTAIFDIILSSCNDYSGMYTDLSTPVSSMINALLYIRYIEVAEKREI